VSTELTNAINELKDLYGIEPLFTVDQVAEYVQMKPTTVRQWIRDGSLVGVRYGKSYRISETALRRFLDERTVNRK
jgi:excisionase family DNA binding protein